MEKKEREEQNEYAENIKGEPLFILDVESGRKGYFCIGCKNEMQAVKSDIKGRRSYFRHDPHDVKKKERKCVFSNQDYRHNQAVFILNGLKRIKVPALYKYPPAGVNGKAIHIRDSEFIEASYTKSEITFYETDTGEVEYGKNPDIDSRNLLIRPDVTFFNAQNKPILLIEIVVTHTISPEKLAKIRRLGIDTVQITIPKDSLENIEKSFSRTNNIEWVYNYEKEFTEYIFAPNDDPKGISQTDELQRNLFGESFKCRQFQIKDLIRTIEKCLGSQQYREIERDFRAEISRVEENTERLRKELEKRRGKIRKGVSERFEERRIQIRSADARIEDENRAFQESREDFEGSFEVRRKELEERYLRKRGELEDQIREVEKSLEGTEDFERTKSAIREQTRDTESEIGNTESRIGNIIQSRKGLPGKYKRIQEQEQSRLSQRRIEIKENRRGIAKKYRGKKKEVETEAEGDRSAAIEKIKRRDPQGESELSGRIKAILDAGRFFNDWNERKDTLQRNRTALESFRKGTYKEWYRP